MPFQSSRPAEMSWATTSTSGSNRRNSQTSPLGGRFGATCDTSNTALLPSYATSSSCDGSWTSGATDHEEVEGDGISDEWEQDSNTASIVPKIEPIEDNDVAMAKLGHMPLAPKETTNSSFKQKRPRGRPKKNTVPVAANSTKVVKGRSKTGCITCRKRKKKCDEAKPGCLNCEKNSVVCEGYNEKQLWRSATERRAEEGRLKREFFPAVTLPAIVLGLETAEDKMFYDHYVNRLSNVLTVETEQRNAFRDLLFNLATKHQGLLHSIMAISSMHIDTATPYGSALLHRHPNVSRESLQQRSSYHVSAAWTCLRSDIDKSESLDPDDPDSQLILAARYGQMICLVLQNLIEGSPRGEHRVHLQAYQKLIRHSPPHDMALHAFITEFFQYHIYADDILWHPENHIPRLSVEEADFETSADGSMACLLGVKDGLFQHLREITSLCNIIRKRMVDSNNSPAASYVEIIQANDIGQALQSWKPNWRAGDSRAKAGELYRLALWIYLFRTAFPPATGNSDNTFGGSSMMGFMSGRRSSIASSTGQLSSGFCEETFPREQNYMLSRHASRTNSMHEEDALPTPATTQGNGSSCPPSPPPSRRPSQDDKRVAPSIMEALGIIESFDPSEPCQTLLLLPCLLLGTACFDATQHPRIRAAVQAVRNYTGLRNADRVQEVLDETWALMDRGDWAAVWDWQIIASRRGLDFLCT